MRKLVGLSLLVLLPLLASCSGGQFGPNSRKDPTQYRPYVHKSQYDIPVTLNDRTAAWIDFYKNRGRKHFARHLGRSHRYIPAMRKILKSHGLPQDLVYIALIESGFNSKAYSHAHASGFWQFIRTTGQRYNLQIDRHVDERRDFEKATHSAARYLKYLHGLFGDWHLAAAAYNAGEGRIMRAIKKHNTKNLWEIIETTHLHKETRNYVPKLLAAMIIAKNPGRFGFNDVVAQEPLKYDKVTIKGRPIDLRVVAKMIGTDKKTLQTLNPELRHETTPPKRSTYTLRVPQNQAPRFYAKLNRLPKHMRLAEKEHVVASGDNLDTLAQRHKMSIEYLASANGLRTSSSLRAGQRIGIPFAPPKNTYVPRGGRNKVHYHRVKSGESLWKIAKNYKVSIKDLRKWNKGKIGRHLKTGQKIVVRGGKIKKSSSYAKNSATPTKNTAYYKVKRGDTLSVIAQKHGVRTKDIKAWNQGKIGKFIKEGQKLAVSNPKKTAKTTVAKTSTKSTSGKSTIYHRVKRGDTLSGIASLYGVRTKDLKVWNEGKIGKFVKIGQKLTVRNPQRGAPVAVAKAAPEQTAAAKNERPRYHKIKSGETLSTIAQQYRVRTSDLRRWNEGKIGKFIKSGQKLALYGGSATPKASAKENSSKTVAAAPKASSSGGNYKVKPGESLWTIAQKNNVSVKDLKRWNGDSLGKHLKAGQRIKIVKGTGTSKRVASANKPAAAKSPSSKKRVLHTISSGDTLWDIAKKYGVKTIDIKKWNGIDQANSLKPGDKLKIYVKRSAAAGA